VIVFGLGTGRSGTASLAKLLNAQKDALCFHEMNPSCVRFYNTPRPILNTVDEYQTILNGGDPSMLTVDLGRGMAAKAYDELCTMKRVRLIGDIAFYYLSYVEAIAAHNPNVRFICLKRDKDATVKSWMAKSQVERWRSKRIADKLGAAITREPYHESRNFWMDHDGTQWRKDPTWDKCFPKFPGPTKLKAIEQYWDFYYEESEKLAAKYPAIFKIVTSEDINITAHQVDLLDFCGVHKEDMVFTDAHIHRLATKE